MLAPRLRVILIIILFVGLAITGNLLSEGFIEQIKLEITPANQPTVYLILIALMFAYIILMATPFVPGAEIGLAVLMVFGPKIVVFVYLSTLAALSLSFMIGRFMPEKVLIIFFKHLHFHRSSQLLLELEGLDSQQRLSLMLKQSPKRIIPFLLKYRYLAILLAFNLPSNVVIGGGGGIAMMAGLSRLFSPGLYMLTVAIAVSPIPIALLVFGKSLGAWPL